MADWLSQDSKDTNGPPSLDGLIGKEAPAPRMRDQTTDRPPAEIPLDMLDLNPWGSTQVVDTARMAMEIVLYGEDVARLADAYGLTTAQYHKLRKECRTLNREVENAETSIKGKDRVTLRFRDLAMQNMDMLASIMGDPSIEPQHRLKAFELAARYGAIEPDNKTEGGQQNQVNFVIHGAPPGFEVGREVIDAGDIKNRREIHEKKLLSRAARLDRERDEYEAGLRQDDEDEGDEPSPFDGSDEGED